MITIALPPIELTGGMILGDEVYTRIGAAILDGTLSPGYRLRDVELAQQLGISRTPVREALQRLERFGLVEIVVGRYTRVSIPDTALRQDTAEFTLYLMGNALRLALPRCDDAQLTEILQGADAVIEGIRTGDSLAVFDGASVMFASVTKATGNTVFIGVMREGSLAIQRNLRSWPPSSATSASVGDTWQRLRGCIAARDGDGAEQTLRTLRGAT